MLKAVLTGSIFCARPYSDSPDSLNVLESGITNTAVVSRRALAYNIGRNRSVRQQLVYNRCQHSESDRLVRFPVSSVLLKHVPQLVCRQYRTALSCFVPFYDSYGRLILRHSSIYAAYCHHDQSSSKLNSIAICRGGAFFIRLP